MKTGFRDERVGHPMTHPASAKAGGMRNDLLLLPFAAENGFQQTLFKGFFLRRIGLFVGHGLLSIVIVEILH